MPTYEYACKKCGETFEVVQSFTDEPLKRHKGGCGGAVKKVFGNVGISFKGSGFYKNDSRSSSTSSKSSSGSSDSSAPSSSSGDSASKSDSSSTKKADTASTATKAPS